MTTASSNSAFHPVRRWQRGAISAQAADAVAIEEPLEIRVADRSVAVVMRTPGHDRELAAGFLLSEGLVKGTRDILDVLPCRTQEGGESGNVVNVLLDPKVAVDFARLTRHVFSSSSCGICGKATIDGIFQNFHPLAAGPMFPAALLAAVPESLRAAQPIFAATGGLHGCALFSPGGDLATVREDVGRHNAVDKLIGHALLAENLPLTGHGLLLSGRISFELVQKALAGGIPLVAGIGAPSSLAIEFAERANITLVGFLRADRFNIYTGANRIGSNEASQ